MWKYVQKTGELFDSQGHCAGVGYSGHGEGKNNPEMQEVRNVGPIPVGTYSIGPLHDTDKHGPDVMALTPVQGTDTFGRSAFLMHGDKIKDPGTASEGCIIQAHATRLAVAKSEDKLLEVV